MPEKPVFSNMMTMPVRVSIPAKVAFNLKEMNKVTAEILGRLGCPGCHSGFDIRFELATRFEVDEKLNIRNVPAGIEF